MTRPPTYPKHGKRLSGFFGGRSGGDGSTALALPIPRKDESKLDQASADRASPRRFNKGGRAGMRRHQKGGAGGGDIGSALSVSAIKRLAKRAGVKRISKPAFGDIRQSLVEFLLPLMSDLVVIVEHARRRTVSTMDVLRALKRRGRIMYGYGDYLPEQMKQAKRRVARLRQPLPKFASHDAIQGSARQCEAAVADATVELGSTPTKDPACSMDDDRQLQVQIAIADVMQHMSECHVARLLSAVNLRLKTSRLETVDAQQLNFLLEKLHNDERLMLDSNIVYLF